MPQLSILLPYNSPSLRLNTSMQFFFGVQTGRVHSDWSNPFCCLDLGRIRPCQDEWPILNYPCWTRNPAKCFTSWSTSRNRKCFPCVKGDGSPKLISWCCYVMLTSLCRLYETDISTPKKSISQKVPEGDWRLPTSHVGMVTTTTIIFLTVAGDTEGYLNAQSH